MSVHGLSYSFVVKFVNQTHSDILLMCDQYETEDNKRISTEKHQFILGKEQTLQKSFNDHAGTQLECITYFANTKMKLSNIKVNLISPDNTIFIKTHDKAL